MLQGLRHGMIAVASGGTVFGSIAIIILQVVDAPRGKRACILLLEAIAGGASTTCQLRRIRVDAEFQALGMDVIGNGFHAIRKLLGVWDDIVVLVSSSLP